MVDVEQLQYIGARYVPKIYKNSVDPSSAEWESGVNYEPLTIVTEGYNSFTSRDYVPKTVGRPSENGVYWARTGNYDGQIASLQQQIDDMNDGNIAGTLQNQINVIKHTNDTIFINVLDYGCVGDGVTDNYDALFDLMHKIANNDVAAKIVYFPSGKYVISDTIFIPDNVTLMGAGYSSEIYYNGTYAPFGIGFAVVGNNVTIKNFRLNHYEQSATIITGNMYGAIGISNKVFSDWSTKHAVDTDFTHVENHYNVTVSDIVSESNYVVQTETSGASFKNITYRNIYAPRAKVSYKAAIPDRVDNILIENVTCTAVGSFGSQSGTTDLSIMKHITAAIVSNTAKVSYISDCIFDTGLDEGSDVQLRLLWMGANSITNISNCIFKGNNVNHDRYLDAGDGNVCNLVNCKFESGAFTVGYYTEYVDTTELNAVNCDFDLSLTIMAKYGSAVNSKGNFRQNGLFIDKTKLPSITTLEWTESTSTWGGLVTADVTLYPGTYYAEITVPTSDDEFVFQIQNIPQDDFWFKGGSRSRVSHVFTITENTVVGVRALQSGRTFTDLNTGYMKIVKLT